jgi:hypothetical protein
MPTLGDMKAHIADDVDDTTGEYTSQIARAITRAIAHYERHRFYFNEIRDIDIPCAPGQDFYDETDEPRIKSLLHIDNAFLIDGATVNIATADDDELTADLSEEQVASMAYHLQWVTPASIETLSDSGASFGRPRCYSYHDQKIRIYPFPDTEFYSIRLHAWIRLDAPTEETDSNPWTNEAYDLIVARAKRYLATNTLRDAEMAIAAKIDEDEQFDLLKRETSSKNGSGLIRPTCF